MAIKIMADSGGTITYTAAEIGAAWNTFACNSDYIISGCGGEMQIGYSSSSLVITVANGKGVICGRVVSLTGSESFTLEPNKTSGGFLVLRADLSMPVGSEGYLAWCDTESAIKTENLNNINGKHDLKLAKITTSGAGVVSVEDLRDIRSTISPTAIPTKLSQLENDLNYRNKWGVDPSRELCNVYGNSNGGAKTISWTATEDCLVFFPMVPSYTYIYVDGVRWLGDGNGSFQTYGSWPINKDQVVSMYIPANDYGLWEGRIRAFAIK